MSDREAHTDQFYLLLDQLAARLSGVRRLRDSTAAGWPSHGVYFFYEAGEARVNGSPRVVRVGTHALTLTSRTTLWTRLAQHRGRVAGRHPGGGNHRSSIFRHHVGTALLAAGDWPPHIGASWPENKVEREAGLAEYPLERAVSDYIGSMPMIWLPVDDREVRSLVERSSISLLSCRIGGLDRPSPAWLGRFADNEKVRTSGLWNVNHVDEPYDISYFDVLRRIIDANG